MLSISVACEIIDYSDTEKEYIKNISDSYQSFNSLLSVYLYLLSLMFINKDTVELNIVCNYMMDYLGW